MRIVMTLLVRDEADIVRDTLDAHYALGVDHVIATDNLSVDGTDTILEEYQAQGRLHLLRETADTYDQARWVTRMARMAATDLGADWVVNADADEFWLPVDGDLRSTLASVPDDVGVVTVHRWNFVCRDDGPTVGEAVADAPTGDDDPWYERLRWRYAAEVNHEGITLPTKVVHRAHPEAEVFMGNHWVTHDAGAELDDGRIQLMHYPMRSYLQFVAKILVGGQALENNEEMDPALVSTWRRALATHRAGQFEEQWRAWVPTDDELSSMIAAGTVVEDRRVGDLLHGLRAAPVPEPAPATGRRGRLRRRR